MRMAIHFARLAVLWTAPLVMFGSSHAAELDAKSELAGAKPEATAESPEATAATMETLDDTHRLSRGDRLTLRIIEDPEEPKALVVTDSGDLDIPYIGRFAAEGKTCKQLARELKAELEKEYFYQATVILALDQLGPTRGKIYLSGAIRIPGPQEIPSDEEFTLSKAILRAGGFADFADKRRVRVTRKTESGEENKSKVITVNVEEILERGRTEKDLPLKPGDLINVPKRFLNF